MADALSCSEIAELVILPRRGSMYGQGSMNMAAGHTLFSRMLSILSIFGINVSIISQKIVLTQCHSHL